VPNSMMDEHKEQWPGIGYTFCIAEDGKTFWCNDLETASYHVSGHNEHTLGICLLGCFVDGAEPTGAQIAATNRLLADLRKLIPFENLVGHQDLVATVCPGDTWPSWKVLLDGQSGEEVEHLRQRIEVLETEVDRIEGMVETEMGRVDRLIGAGIARLDGFLNDLWTIAGGG